MIELKFNEAISGSNSVIVVPERRLQIVMLNSLEVPAGTSDDERTPIDIIVSLKSGETMEIKSTAFVFGGAIDLIGGRTTRRFGVAIPDDIPRFDIESIRSK